MRNFDLEKDKKIGTGFKTPENYFEDFEERMMQHISFENEKIETGFKTPSNYFETFEDRLMQRLSFEENKIDTGFVIPETYFDSLEDSVMRKISTAIKQPKVISLWQRKSFWISGIAATVVISLATIFYFNQLETQNNLATQEYLVYSSDLTTDEIANELTETEINNLENELVVLDKQETEQYINEYLN